MSTNFDRIFASTPGDAVAGRVTGKGEHYEPVVNIGTRAHFESQPPIVPPDEIRHPDARAHALSIVGRRIGRMVVVGMSATWNRNSKTNWVLRCDCGCFEHRKWKTIQNPKDASAWMCVKCTHYESAKRRYETKGSRPLSDFTEPRK